MAIATTLVRSEVVGGSKVQVFDVVLSGSATEGKVSTGLDFVYHASVSSSTAASKPTVGKNLSDDTTASNGDVFIDDASADDAGISLFVYGR